MLFIGKSLFFSGFLRTRYVQSVFSFTSDQLGIGVTGPVRTVINRFDLSKLMITDKQVLNLP